MELMTPEVGTIFWTGVTFVILMLILGKVAWKPILSMLDERESKIAESLEQAEIARNEAQQRLEEQNKKIEEARKEAQDMIAKSKKSAESAREEMMNKAREESDHMIERAKKEIEASRDNVIKEIQDIAVELSMRTVEKVIGKSLDKKEHQKLVEDSIKKMDNLN